MIARLRIGRTGVIRRGLLLAVLAACLSGCLGIPDDAEAVRGFEVDRYLGTWYEIARLDHRFERGLTQIKAEYSLRDDGGIRVINSGFDSEEGERRSAEGRAYFVEGADVGRLKVSFFGPFYGAYNIIELDRQDYRYALVVGADTSYMWILAREPTLDQAIIDRLLDKAGVLGFATDELIFPEPYGPQT